MPLHSPGRGYERAKGSAPPPRPPLKGEGVYRGSPRSAPTLTPDRPKAPIDWRSAAHRQSPQCPFIKPLNRNPPALVRQKGNQHVTDFDIGRQAIRMARGRAGCQHLPARLSKP